MSVHWEEIHHEHVSSFDCLQTYTAKAERELGAKHEKQQQLLNINLTSTAVFVGREVFRKGHFFFLPRAPEAILINFPLKWEITALHCSVVSILSGEGIKQPDKAAMTHH